MIVTRICVSVVVVQVLPVFVAIPPHFIFPRFVIIVNDEDDDDDNRNNGIDFDNLFVVFVDREITSGRVWNFCRRGYI